MPLYWLTRNNGVLYPATTILIIHHANKQGGFRGTSAIRDAVNETWSLKKPEGEALERLGQHTRIISIEKSRCGRSGTQLLMQQEADLSFSLRDFTPEVDPQDTTPASHSDRVLQRLRTVFPRSLSRQDLDADPLLGGTVAATRKALQRLEKRGLIRVVEAIQLPKGGVPLNMYQAVLSTTRGRGETAEGVPHEQNPSAGTDLQWDAPPKTQGGVPSVDGSHQSAPKAMGHPLQNKQGCPNADPSAGAGSAHLGHPTEYPRARRGSLEEATEAWDE